MTSCNFVATHLTLTINFIPILIILLIILEFSCLHLGSLYPRIFLNKCCFLKPHNLFEELLLILVGNNNAKTFRKSFYLFPWLMVSFVRKWKLLKWKINCPKNVFSFCGSLKTFSCRVVVLRTILATTMHIFGCRTC